VLAALVVVDLTGALGVHTATARASNHGYALTVHYPSVARAGLDVSWRVEVRHAGGFGKQVVLRVRSDYVQLLGSPSYSPQPASSTSDGTWTYLTFAAPAGDTFAAAVDADVPSSSQRGRSTTVAVLDGSGDVLVSAAQRTRLVP
jgi:hypothetical protein